MTKFLGLSKGLVPVLALCASTALFAGNGDDQGGDHDGDRGQSRVQRGFALAPVPLSLHGKNHDLVGLGSYIVNAQGGCNDCHTCPPYTPEHDPYVGGDGAYNSANYLAGGATFGPFVSRNITPDASGLPAGLTRDEFIDVLRHGHDPENPANLLQVMPWPVYGRMLTRDLKAVYEYLRSIPHAEPGPGCAAPPDAASATH
jgi:hypothetical protein